MLNLVKVAITGNLNSGKTTVCKLLQKHGAYVLDSDAIVHKLLEYPTIICQIKTLFGDDVEDEHGKINKAKLSDLIFRDENLVKKLENLLHPQVLTEIKRQYQVFLSKPHLASLFVVEVPLLFEAQMQPWFDSVVLIVADKELRKGRFTKQGHDESSFYLRNSRQIDPDKARTLADIIIENNGDINQLEQKVLLLLEKFKTKQK